MDDAIPPLTGPADTAPVRTQDDLQRLRRALMGPLGFGGRSLWLLVLDADNRPTPLIMQVEDLPPRPEIAQLDALVRMCRQILDGPLGGGSVVLLLSRPGRCGLTADDAAWARGLHGAVRRAELPMWPIHRANDDELSVCTPDDLSASA
jgi:hypothetical protein